MQISICGAPCSWGVDDINNPYLPPWKKVLAEAGEAGYQAIELGPYGFLPLDVQEVTEELQKNGLAVIAGTIFGDLASEAGYEDILEQVDKVCSFLTKLPAPPAYAGQNFPAPYLTIMDWGHDERDYAAGHGDRAPRMEPERWKKMMEHIREFSKKAGSYGIRPVVHPHAGGYIEFEDELEMLADDMPYDIAGFCLDTGHLYYSGMNPAEYLKKYAPILDYIHFKDIDLTVYKQVMREKIRFFEGCARGSMCPIGKGILDYPGIKKTLEEIGYSGYITIEQERDPKNSNGSLEDVKLSIEYLKKSGYSI